MKLTSITALLLALSLSQADAHAMLESATPAVGATIAASPSEIRIEFSEGVEPAFSGIALLGPDGRPVATSKAVLAGPQTLTIRVAGPMKPGSYVVKWHVVATDTHRTAGSYKFTIAP